MNHFVGNAIEEPTGIRMPTLSARRTNESNDVQDNEQISVELPERFSLSCFRPPLTDAPAPAAGCPRSGVMSDRWNPNRRSGESKAFVPVGYQALWPDLLTGVW